MKAILSVLLKISVDRLVSKSDIYFYIRNMGVVVFEVVVFHVLLCFLLCGSVAR